MKRLNLGCGSRVHSAWTNVDVYVSAPGVIACDLQKGIPFPDASFDVVYHSHVLEHLSAATAPEMIRECYRVLRPGGILRVVVPDLELIARLYLEKLEGALAGSPGAEANYRWMVMELFDQTVRCTPGGEILKVLSATDIPNEAFILQRWGVEARKNIERARGSSEAARDEGGPLWKRLFRPLYRLVRYRQYRRELIRRCRDFALKCVLGRDWPLLELGRFRAGGTVHQWMYDRYSLSRLLSECGFSQVSQRSAHESAVAGWSAFHLDTEPDGTVYKPDSLFMEGIKPQ